VGKVEKEKKGKCGKWDGERRILLSLMHVSDRVSNPTITNKYMSLI
jgi:hypothetical protein